MTQDGILSSSVPAGLEHHTVPPSSVPGIDSRGWAEPKETFPGTVIVSTKRECDPKYMEPNQFRTVPLPRPVWQWHLEVERLDARYQLPDGSQAPVIIYGGFDLERWNDRTRQIEPINTRSNKEALISDAWVNIFGSVEPAESLTGKIAMFDYYQSKRIGRNIARRILLPVGALEPTYEFTGEVQMFVVARTEDTVTTAGDNGAGSSNQTANLTDEAVYASLPQLLDGLNRTNPSLLIKALPAMYRTGKVTNGLITGTLLTELEADEKITIDTDNIIKALVPVTA